MPALPPPPLPERGAAWALFADIDGTLVDFAARPDDVVLPPPLLNMLGRLRDALRGALAVLSGRDLDAIDRMLAPLELPVGAVHGLHWRDARGRRHMQAPPPDIAAAVERACAVLAAALPGVSLESKSGIAFALHYRNAPQHAVAVRERAARLAARFAPHYLLQPGDCVAELKPAGGDKGSALRALYGDAPFHGRLPIAVGDDYTDEAAFAAARVLGGFGIVVGTRRPTAATYALPAPRDVAAWLERSIERLVGASGGST